MGLNHDHRSVEDQIAVLDRTNRLRALTEEESARLELLVRKQMQKQRRYMGLVGTGPETRLNARGR